MSGASSAHVISALGGEASGTAYVVPALIRAVAAAGGRSTLFTQDPPDNPQLATIDHLSFARDFASTPVLRQFYLSEAMRTAIRAAAADYDVVHAHGIWQAPSLYAASGARAAKRPFILSPHGMLSPGAMRFSCLRKRVLWQLAQGRAVRSAAVIHVTSDLEHREIRELGLTQPVAQIACGVDVPHIAADDPAGTTILAIGRIHPKKGLDRLLSAWAAIHTCHPEFDIVIAGPDEGGHLAELEAIAARLALPRVRFLPPVLGEAKWRLYRNAALLALPTHSENFGMVVAESLASGTPVICSKGAPWGGLETHGCGWWIDHGVDPLVAALDTALAMTAAQRRAMGERGRAWMIESFGWEALGRQMLDVYTWLGRGGERPSSIRTD